MRKNRLKRLLEVLLGDRKRRLAVLGGVAFAAFVPAIALAQTPPSPTAGATTHETVPAEHGAQPSQAGAAQEGPGGEEHGAAHEGGHEHHPAPFNFIDTDRWRQEKADAEKGKPVTPVTPFAYLLINAAILYGAYYYFGKKPVGDGLAARRATVARELDDAAKVKAEAEERLGEYKTRLADMDKELKTIREEIIASGEKERDRIVKEAEEKAERMRKDAQFLLEQEMKQLRNDLVRHAVDAATIAAEDVLRGKLTAQDHERLGEEYLAQLGAAKPAGAQTTKGGVA